MLGRLVRVREDVSLRPPEPGESRLYAMWAGDPDVSYFWWPRAGRWSPKALDDDFRARCASTTAVHWTLTVDGQAVGDAGILRIDWVVRHAEPFLLIGDTRIQGRGIGRAVAQAQADYAFRDLNLERLFTWIAYENVPSRRMLERTGWRERGLARGIMRRGRRYLDVWAGELLRDEWEQHRSPADGKS